MTNGDGITDRNGAPLMDAFSIAAELLGDLKLTSGQLGQLRALDYRLLLEVDRLSKLSPSTSEHVDTPTTEQAAALRAMIVSEILEMLTPEQRATLHRR